MRIILAILAAGLGLFFGAILGMMLGGFGICAASLSAGLIGGALLAAVLISLMGAAALPAARWLAPVSFSLAMSFGILFAVMSKEWMRCWAIGACVIAAFASVWLLRRYQRTSHDGVA